MENTEQTASMTKSTEDERKDYRSRVIAATKDYMSGKKGQSKQHRAKRLPKERRLF